MADKIGKRTEEYQKMYDSFSRRIMKTGNAWRWMELRLMKHIHRLGPIESWNWLFKLLRRVPMVWIDLMESLYLLKPVPNFGNNTKIYSLTQNAFPQHPGYLDYWYDPDINALVGLHLGLDLILRDSKFNFVEMNSNAGVREPQRKLFDSEYDPIITSYLRFAKKKGFRKIYLFKNIWPEYFEKEIKSINQKQGIEFRLSYPLKGGLENAMPIPLERNTLYVIMHSKLTCGQKLLNNKLSLSKWLPDLYKQHKHFIQSFQLIPTWDHFHFPANNNPENLPNLVVKLADFDAKKAIVMIRANDEAQARSILGIHNDTSLPKVFDLNAMEKLQVRLFQYKSIYQPFVASDFTENNCLHFHRVHGFFSPLENLFVFGMRNTSLIPVPDKLSTGVIREKGAFVPWLTTGSEFDAISEKEVILGKQLVKELGMLIHYIMKDRFIIGPK